ncbi:MAG: hypothetical protein ACRCSN_14530 [Dermatophilaceae bacterium]
MFSTDEDSARRTGLFGSLFFQTTPAPDGAVRASMGVAGFSGLLGTFVTLVVTLTMSQFMYRWLKGYRAHLIAERAGSRDG